MSLEELKKLHDQIKSFKRLIPDLNLEIGYAEKVKDITGKARILGVEFKDINIAKIESSFTDLIRELKRGVKNETN